MTPLRQFGDSPLVRVLALFALVLVLQVPACMIGDLARTREQSRNEAGAEIATTWGARQDVIGPLLMVPYRVRYEEKPGKWAFTETRHATFLPETLGVEATVETEARRRGIFALPVYRARLNVSGQFAPRAALAQRLDAAHHYDWERAELALYVSDLHALDQQPGLQWNARTAGFEPGDGGGLRAPAALPEGGGSFTVGLALRGTSGLRVAPMGRETRVSLQSNWPHPSFAGAWLPATRAVRPDGFAAAWSIPYAARGLPSAWSEGRDAEAIAKTLFGVDFLYPVDPYRMSERSVKYAALFIGLTFLAVWLFELRAGARVHLIQYLLVGAALCLFYLLELSLAEHLGFPAAYALGAAGVTLQVGLYGRSALGGGARSTALAAGIAGLYALLYLLLRAEDYALLIGSGALFAALSTVMFLTRRLDWGAPRSSAEAPARQ